MAPQLSLELPEARQQLSS